VILGIICFCNWATNLWNSLPVFYQHIRSISHWQSQFKGRRLSQYGSWRICQSYLGSLVHSATQSSPDILISRITMHFGYAKPRQSDLEVKNLHVHNLKLCNTCILSIFSMVLSAWLLVSIPAKR